MCYNERCKKSEKFPTIFIVIFNKNYPLGGLKLNFDDVLKQLKNNENKIVAVAVAEDEEVLLSIKNAKDRDLCSAILVGDSQKIKVIADKINMDLDKFEVIDEKDGIKACEVATKLVSTGKAQALMKGLIDTSYILKAALNKDWGLRTESVMSHIGVFEMPLYHKLLFIVDPAININPDLETKKKIINNSVEAIVNMGIDKPKVAIVCAKEKVNPKMQSTVDASELVDYFADNDGCTVEGPIAFDGAISKKACEIKGIDTKVGGDVDLILFDNIEAGNAVYKTLTYLTESKSGGVVVGTKRPIILTSRSDSNESKLISIALGLMM